MVQCRPAKLVAFATAIVLAFQSPVLAQESPRESCAEIANLTARNQLSKVPGVIEKASRGNIAIEAKLLAVLQPTIDAGPVRVNDFLLEKNYNDTLLKTWYLLYFDWESMYLRCTYLKADGDWILINFKFESDEEDIELP